MGSLRVVERIKQPESRSGRRRAAAVVNVRIAFIVHLPF
jgi:hypothetical protein